MKKLFVIASMTLAMVACTSQEDTEMSLDTHSDMQEIVFTPLSKSLSRADVNVENGRDFNTANIIYASAIYFPEGETAGREYFVGKTFKYFGDASGFKKYKYWDDGNFSTLYAPLGGNMRYLAMATALEIPKEDISVYYTKNSDLEVADLSAGDPIFDFGGVTFNFRDKLNGKEDVMYYNEMYDSPTTAGGFYFTFKHTQCLLKFKVKAANGDVASKIKINYITVNNANISAPLTVKVWDAKVTNTPSVPNHANVTYSWDLDNVVKTDKKQIYRFNDDNTPMQVTTDFQDFGYILLIGQEGIEFTVNYDYIDGEETISGLNSTVKETGATLYNGSVQYISIIIDPKEIVHSVGTTDIYTTSVASSWDQPTVTIK